MFIPSSFTVPITVSIGVEMKCLSFMFFKTSFIVIGMMIGAVNDRRTSFLGQEDIYQAYEVLQDTNPGKRCALFQLNIEVSLHLSQSSRLVVKVTEFLTQCGYSNIHIYAFKVPKRQLG